MGSYLNPGNSGFSNMRNDVYVDKTEMISLINQTINTPRNLTCISRPRRFGKSFAAKMLCAYYDKTCDSKELFDDLKIAKDDEYLKYLNQYDVIYLDMASVLGVTSSEDAVSYVKRNITEEVLDIYSEVKEAEALFDTLANLVTYTGNKIIMIIDIIGTWCIGIPLCLLAAYVFKWGIVGVYTLLTTEELFRLAVSLIIFRRRKWIISLC